MPTLIRCVLFFAWIALPAGESGAQAPATQGASAIQRSVDGFLRAQTTGLPGTVRYTVGAIDPRVALPACPSLESFLPPGARLWGATTVGVRCNGSTPWTIYVTAEISVTGNYLVTTRTLAPGQPLTPADFAPQTGDLTQLPAGVLTSAEQAIGKIPTAALAPGQPLRQDLLRAPLVVQQGQSVKLLSSGNGFKVSAEGRALNNAQDGQITQVRTLSGQTVSGVARAGGTVDITF